MPDLVLTLIGPDRPGLVEAVAAPVAAHGGNWLESRMAHLAGQFAGILRVEIATEKVPALLAALRALEAQGLRLVVDASPVAPSPGRPKLLDLDLEGLDRPGIVRDISHALAAHGVNIEELTTGLATAAMSGEALFRAQARIAVPPATDLARLRAELERIAGDLMVEVELAEPEERRG